MKYRLMIISVLCVSLISCASRKKVQTQWDYPPSSKIRIIQSYSKKVIAETVLPAIIPIEEVDVPYYVEICTPNSQRIYGKLEIRNCTKITELTNVKVDITPQIIEQVMDNQVSQITVNDPTEEKLILVYTFGNRMPTEMEKTYNKRKIQRY